MKTPEEWFGLLSDEGKADIMKAHITEEAVTERARIQADTEAKKTLFGHNDYHVTRIIGIVALILVAALGTCISHRGVEAWENTHGGATCNEKAK